MRFTVANLIKLSTVSRHQIQWGEDESARRAACPLGTPPSTSAPLTYCLDVSQSISGHTSLPNHTVPRAGLITLAQPDKFTQLQVLDMEFN